MTQFLEALDRVIAGEATCIVDADAQVVVRRLCPGLIWAKIGTETLLIRA